MRPGLQAPDSADGRLAGVYYADVTDTNDPDGLARVKVCLRWLDQGDSFDVGWAAVVTPMVGKNFGWLTPYEIGDTVVVGFEAGDVRRPMVLGGVWSQPAPPPEANGNGANGFRGYASRAGHRLILDDAGAPKVTLATGQVNCTVTVGAYSKSGDGPNAGAAYVPAMAGSGGVAVAALRGKLELSAQGAVKLVAGQHIKINAQTSVGLTAQGSLTLKGGVAKLTSSGPSNYGNRVKLG